MSTLEVQNITKSYGKKTVIRNISMIIESGKTYGILGPNGAGKTTCFYMIAGLIKQNSGNILMDGNDISNLPISQRSKIGIGYLPQENSLFPSMSVEGNILTALEVSMPKKHIKKKLEELLNDLKITKIRKSNALALSGGEKRRVEVARILALNPKFIFLDEPFAGVDPVSIADVRNIIESLKNKGIGVIITDHNVFEILKTVDHSFVIYDGTIVASGSEGEIRNNEIVRKYYLGNSYNN
jgi:lipopolysaccharide export system ATP-binding protein